MLFQVSVSLRVWLEELQEGEGGLNELPQLSPQAERTNRLRHNTER